MASEQNIRVKAMCLFTYEGKVLIQSSSSTKKRNVPEAPPVRADNFYRALGGSLNRFELAEEGIRREIREELGTEIENLQFLQIVENIFTYWGNKEHEIVFLYKADLVNKDLYSKEKIHIVEDVYEFDAEWIEIEKVLSGEVTLFPSADYKKLLHK